MNKPHISLIAAISENRVIGENDRVPWKIKEDLVRLKNLTQNQVVIVGRKTYDSMVEYYKKSGRTMPGKRYIVVTRNPSYKPAFPNDRTASTFGEALSAAKIEIAQEIFVIGGGQIFSQAISIADKLYLTIVHTVLSGDTYFPDYSEFNKVVLKEDKQSDKYFYTFLELEK